MGGGGFPIENASQYVDVACLINGALFDKKKLGNKTMCLIKVAECLTNHPSELPLNIRYEFFLALYYY